MFNINDKVVLINTQTINWPTKENDAIHTVSSVVENSLEGQVIGLDNEKYYARGLPASYFRLATEAELLVGHRLPDEWSGAGFPIYQMEPKVPVITSTMQYTGLDTHRFVADLITNILIPSKHQMVNWNLLDSTTGVVIDAKISNGMKTRNIYIGVNYYVFVDKDNIVRTLSESEMLSKYKVVDDA